MHLQVGVFSIVAALAFAASSSGQHAGHAERLPMHSEDFAPRFAASARTVLRVPAGKVVTLAADSSFDAIEVEGELRNDPTEDTILRVSNLQVLKGGHLNLQVPCGRTLELIIRDTPIDTDVDPFQWGTSILSLGRMTLAGCALKKSFVRAADDLPRGATKIVLEEPVPAGWRIGDELIVPDTRQQPAEPAIPVNAMRESAIAIATISDNTITLSKPLDFDHPAIRAFDGDAIVRPYIANVSRNLTVRSEHPHGTLGHVAALHDSTFDVRHVEFRHLGRTKNVALDPTTNNLSHIGTNQTGRYAFHLHHSQGVGSRFVGNALVGSPGHGKWGVVIHRSSDNLVEGNVIVDFDGSGIVTEEGAEVRNVIRGNLVAYSLGLGGPRNRGGFFYNPDHNNKNGCPGCEGSGIWLQGVQDNTLEDNVAINNRFGITILNRRAFRSYPRRPGGPLDGTLQGPGGWFASFDRNATIANALTGLELWETRGGHPENVESMAKATIARHHLSAHNVANQVFFGPTPVDSGGIVMVDSTVLCHGGSFGLVFPRAYAFVTSFVRTDVRGCYQGITGGGGRNFLYISGGTWQNQINFAFRDTGDAREHPTTSESVVIEKVIYKPYPFPHPALPAAANDIHVISWDGQSPWLPTAQTPTSKCASAQQIYWPDGKTYCLPSVLPTGVRP